jgi:hypothetical protein
MEDFGCALVDLANAEADLRLEPVGTRRFLGVSDR